MDSRHRLAFLPQYVAEPWGHFIYDTELFVEKMRTAVSEYEISSFVFDIHRKRTCLLPRGTASRGA